MESLVKIGGVYCFAFALFHLMFWRLFHWGEDLQSLSSINRAIMQVLNLSLTFAFILFGYLSWFYSKALIEAPLGHAFLVLVSLFWLLRSIWQVVFFKLTHWISVLFLLIFLLGSALFAIPVLSVL